MVQRWPDIEPLLSYGDNAAAADCDVVVIATPWDSAATTAQENEAALNGKVVVSMANALVRVGHEFQPLVPPRGSVAAHVQAAMPNCRVVAAFHHLPATELGHIGEPPATTQPLHGADDLQPERQAFGIEALHVERAEDVDAALQTLLDAKGPALLHVAIDTAANVWPLVPPNRSNSEMMDDIEASPAVAIPSPPTQAPSPQEA